MKKDNDEHISHPSFGLAQLNRTQSSGTLFGSSLTMIQNTVRLTIHTNVELIRGDTGDRYYPHGRSAIEVEFSAAQFAEFVTTMNVGFGVPCTVRRFNGEIIKTPPSLEAEAVKQRKVFGDKMRASVEGLKKHARELRDYLSNSNIPKKHWDPLTKPIQQMLDEVGVNSEFWMELFEEATEKVVKEAKSEVDAFVTSAIHRAGLEHLQGLAAPKPIEMPMLNGKDGE